MTMSDKQDIGPQKRPASTAQIVAQQKSVANELRSGSPLEPVVQGRPESPVPLSLDVQGTHDILAQLRARVIAARDADGKTADESKKHGFIEIACSYRGTVVGYDRVLEWLDELAQPNNTAPDTTSGSAGVP